MKRVHGGKCVKMQFCIGEFGKNGKRNTGVKKVVVDEEATEVTLSY